MLSGGAGSAWTGGAEQVVQLATVEPETRTRIAMPFVHLLRRFSRRLREREFWYVQTLMVSVTTIHYGLEASQFDAQITELHHIPVILYMLAVVYAGIHYGFEGALFTAVMAIVLTIPSVASQHAGSFMWTGEVVGLVVTMSVGAVVAWRVELEAVQRARAEATSRRLALLHDVSSAVTQTLELDRVLQDAVARVAEALESDQVWIAVWEGPNNSPLVLAQTGEPIWRADPGSGPVWEAASRQVQAGARTAQFDGIAVAVPLMVEGRLLGALGTAWRTRHPFTADDVDLLTAMANQIAVGMDNARRYRDEIRMREALRRYAAQVTHAQEEERKRIARELHDETLQSLVFISRELEATLESGCEGAGVRERLSTVRALAQANAESLRRFSRDLRPSILDDLGLTPAIEWLTSDLSHRTGIRASLEVTGEMRRLPPSTELHLFRIVQEGLRNVEKHSGASTVTVSVAFEPAQVAVAIRDNGRGFEGKPLEKGVYAGKLGLLGMQERANLLGADLEVCSRPGQGVEVSVVVAGEAAG